MASSNSKHRAILACLLVLGCASTSLPSDGDPAPRAMVPAPDSSYGYTQSNPIKVGGVSHERGPENERAYLSSLSGPDGQSLTYHRAGSCCKFKTPHGTIANKGLLDVYEITYADLGKPITLYINMYDYETPMVPRGLTRAR